ncbi:MAG: leucine-rich repeat protein, partial [Intestinibacter sp.]
DGEWKDVVVEYDDGNGLLKYIGFADRIISIGVEKDKLPEGDYILVFGAEVCGNNLAKNLGIPVAFKFTTCDNYAGEVDKAEINKLIAEVEEFVFEATVGSEKGQYPSKDEIEAAIADAKAVSENTSATRREVTAAIQALNNAFDEFKKSMVVDVQSVSITSEKKESVYVGQRGTISTEIKVDPDEDQYKEIEYTTSENISIDSDTGKWKALSPGDAYIKVASKKDSTKYDIYEFTVLAREGVDTIIVEAGSTLQSAIDEMLEGTENTYAYFTSIKIITEEGVNLTSDDCTFINKNLTSLEKLDLTEVTFVDYLPESAFKNNTSLKEVVLPDYITTIGSGAFDGCTSLQKVALPSKLRTIASYAFRGCTSLENIEIPSLVVTIGTDAFNGCTSLGTVLKSNAVEPPTMPSTNPFGGTNIATIVVPYGGGDRYKNASIWKDFEIIESEELVLNLEVQAPGTLKEVAEATIKNLGLDGTEVFSLNIKCAEGVVLNSDDEQYIKESFSTAVKIDLSKANFENNKLPDEIFKNRLLIEAVVLPESMTTIGKNAFSGSRNLASINMPNNLETIEDYAFASCSS